MKTVTPILCYAWPDTSTESLSLLLGEWGWQVAGFYNPSSPEELLAVLDNPDKLLQDGEDYWLQGHCCAFGWQILFDYKSQPDIYSMVD